MTPLAIDLFCGLGGWTDGLLAEGYRVVGFDIERHVYGEQRYPAQLVLQDVLTIHGRQFKTADLIVASPPCQEFSYMAMPWCKAKQKRADYLNGNYILYSLCGVGLSANGQEQASGAEKTPTNDPRKTAGQEEKEEWLTAFSCGRVAAVASLPGLPP